MIEEEKFGPISFTLGKDKKGWGVEDILQPKGVALI